MRVFIVALAILMCSPAFAKDYAQRFPNGTSLEVYTPNNPPPGIEEAPIDTKQYVRSDGAWKEVTIPAGTNKRVATFVFDGNYASPQAGTITTPAKAGYDGTITGWVITNADSLAKVSSSIVLTIYKNGVAISGSEKPTLSNQTTNTDTDLTTWTSTSFSKGDEFVAYVTSASTGIRYACYLYAEATT